MAFAVSVRGLRKNYGNFTAVDGIDFDVEQGHLFAFLGPNGAGKSTTINIMSTLLSKDEGQVLVNGFEVGKQDNDVRKSIGLVFQDNVLDALLTVKENLLVRGGLYGDSTAELHRQLKKVTEVMDIGELLHRPYGKLSGGQRRRAEIARALMNHPEILIMDEPTTGLDPQTRLKVWENITLLQKELKMTVFLTTHYMEEAAGADMVAVIDHGRIIATDTPAQLRAKYTQDVLRLMSDDGAALTDTLARKGYKPVAEGGFIEVKVHDSMEALRLLNELEGGYIGFEVVRGKMDDMFISLTGRAIREEES